MNLLIPLFGLVLLATSPVSLADAPDTAHTLPPEVTVGSIHCKAEWNEFCEDQKTIQVPDGYKLCKNTVTVKEKSGDSAYEITDTNTTGITVKFNAKGNRNRLKPEGAVIDLSISLQGVRIDDDCSGNVMIKPTASNVDAPTPQAAATTAVPLMTNMMPKIAPKTEAPVAAAKSLHASSEPNINACACSEWMQADKVTSCLIHGYGHDKISCDTLPASIQCVASKDECHDVQKENCPEVLGIDKTLSRKRLFVPDSPYCRNLIAK
jgi:hypothetical protein